MHAGAGRRAYYVMAKRMHPDKCQGADAVGAKERFQRICEAYQVQGCPHAHISYETAGLQTLHAMRIQAGMCLHSCQRAGVVGGLGVASCAATPLCSAQARSAFQKPCVGEQVLGNAELRERYDAGGQKALDINFMEVRALSLL